jgi:hypothetical protein
MRPNIGRGSAIPCGDDLELVVLTQLEHLVCGLNKRAKDDADGRSTFRSSREFPFGRLDAYECDARASGKPTDSLELKIANGTITVVESAPRL